MTPFYLDSQEAVDRHNERVKVQREAGYKTLMAVSPLVSPGLVQKNLDLDKLFPFAELRPSGFVGGSGVRWEYRKGFCVGTMHEGVRRWTNLDPSDRAAASAALTGGVEAWAVALLKVATNHGCGFSDAANKYKSEVIAEAQALLDREGGK